MFKIIKIAKHFPKIATIYLCIFYASRKLSKDLQEDLLIDQLIQSPISAKFLWDNRTSSHCGGSIFHKITPRNFRNVRLPMLSKSASRMPIYASWMQEFPLECIVSHIASENEWKHTFGSHTLIFWYRSHAMKFDDDYALEVNIKYNKKACSRASVISLW